MYILLHAAIRSAINSLTCTLAVVTHQYQNRVSDSLCARINIYIEAPNNGPFDIICNAGIRVGRIR